MSRDPDGTGLTSFEALLAEGESVPVEGWDFSWFAGRATEERPPWGYQSLLGERMARASAALDLQTGGGEVVAGVPAAPPVLLATESWPPNLALAERALARHGGHVVAAADGGDLPFRSSAFDLVSSRHPTVTNWAEVARVLRPGGTYLSQQVGVASVHELSVAMLGPFEPALARDPDRTAAAAEAVGLTVTDLRRARLRMSFRDIAAVVVFLRKVIWIVPGFSVERFRPRLTEVHERIRADGEFVAHSTRFLIEARKQG